MELCQGSENERKNIFKPSAEGGKCLLSPFNRKTNEKHSTNAGSSGTCPEKMRNDEFRFFSFVPSYFPHFGQANLKQYNEAEKKPRSKTFPYFDEVGMKSNFCEVNEFRSLTSICGSSGTKPIRKCGKTKNKLSTDSQSTPILMDKY